MSFALPFQLYFPLLTSILPAPGQLPRCPLNPPHSWLLLLLLPLKLLRTLSLPDMLCLPLLVYANLLHPSRPGWSPVSPIKVFLTFTSLFKLCSVLADLQSWPNCVVLDYRMSYLAPQEIHICVPWFFFQPKLPGDRVHIYHGISTTFITPWCKGGTQYIFNQKVEIVLYFSVLFQCLTHGTDLINVV